jgi:hypothetical protein
MGPLFEGASAKPSVEFVNDVNEAKRDGWEYIYMEDGSTVAVDSPALEDVITSCNHIFFFCSEMKGDYFPYVQRTLDIMLPFLEDDSQENIRASVYLTIPHLFDSILIYLQTNNAPMDYLFQVFQESFPLLFQSVHEFVERLSVTGTSQYDSLSEQSDLTILQYGIESIHRCLSMLKENSVLNSNMVSLLVDEMLNILEYLQQYRNTVLGNLYEDDEDQNFLMMEDVDQEEDILCELVELVGALASYYTSVFLDIADQKGLLNFCQLAIHQGYNSEKMLQFVSSMISCQIIERRVMYYLNFLFHIYFRIFYRHTPD